MITESQLQNDIGLIRQEYNGNRIKLQELTNRQKFLEGKFESLNEMLKWLKDEEKISLNDTGTVVVEEPSK